MNRGITLAVVAALTLAIAGFVFWLSDADGADSSVTGSIVTPMATTNSLPTVLPEGVTARDAQPLESADQTPADSESPDIAATAAQQLHAWPMKRLTLSGRVVDARGQPLQGARVILNPSRQSRRQLGFPRHYFLEPPAWDDYPQAVTAADGGYAFSTQAAGDTDGKRIPIPDGVRYEYNSATTLVARLDGYVPAAVLVPTDSWSVAMDDVVLEDSGIVIGRVVDAPGRPLADMRIAIGTYGRKDDGSDKPDWSLVSLLIEASTRPDGRFRLDTLDPGRYRLEIVGEGYQAASIDVEVTAGQTVDHGDIVMDAGRVLAGRVVDEEGRGLPGAKLKVRPSNMLNRSSGQDTAYRDMRVTVRSSSGDREVSGETDPAGRFRFADLDDTEYNLFAADEQREPVVLRKLTPDRLDLEIVLPAEALIVLWVVDDITGDPVWAQGVSITRVSKRGAAEPDMMDPPLTVLEHRAAAERLGLDESGEGLYVGGPAGFIGHRVRITSGDHAPLEVQLPGLQPGEVHEQTLRLARASTVSGRVTDSHGSPLADVQITVHPVDPDDTGDDTGDGTGHGTGDRKRVATESADDGRYTVDGLSEGEWTLEATLDERIPLVPVPVTLGAAQQLEDMDVVLHLGARVSGVVYAADGRPAVAHEVLAMERTSNDDPEQVAKTRTTTDGRFLLTGLSPGPLTLTAAPGARVDIHATLDEELVVDLALRRSPRLSGRVRDASGAPVSCAVQLYSGGQRWPAAETRSDEQGEYHLEDLFPGPATLIARRDGETRTPPVTVTLDYGVDEVRDLQFSGGRIVGRVTLQDTGAPAAHVSVTATRIKKDGETVEGIGALRSKAYSGDDGRYEVDALEPGRYHLRYGNNEYVAVDPGSVAVTLAGAELEQDLRVTLAATLVGRVSTVGEAESDSLSLRLQRIDRPGNRFMGIPFEGDYEVRGITAGRYSYEVKRNRRMPPLPDQDHVFATGELTFVSGETTAHDILLVPMDG